MAGPGSQCWPGGWGRRHPSLLHAAHTGCLLHCLPPPHCHLDVNLVPPTQLSINCTVLFMPQRKKYSRTWTNEALAWRSFVVTIYFLVEATKRLSTSIWHFAQNSERKLLSGFCLCTAHQKAYVHLSEIEQHPLSTATEIPGIHSKWVQHLQENPILVELREARAKYALDGKARVQGFSCHFIP